MNYIETGKDSSGNAVKIHYNDYGKGDPIILISGWPLGGEMWEYQINDLVNSGYRVITYDRRGFGKSSHPWDGYNYDTLTDDLKSLIDTLKLQNITLVGFSMGGGEVVRYFSRYGGMGVSKVVLIAAVTPYMLQTESNPSGTPHAAFEDMLTNMQNDRIGFLDEFGRTFFGMGVFSKPLSTPLLEYYRMLCSFASPRAMQECAKAFSSTDFRNEMHTVKVPTLIIHGDADKTVPIEASAKQTVNYITGSKLLIYEGAPHGLFYNEKERLNMDLLKFLRGEDPTVENPILHDSFIPDELFRGI